MSPTELDRKTLKESAERDSATADMKQHANKLIQGFEAFDKTHVRRAIWELVQNARDLSANSEIKICLTNESISFTHNGKPFTSQTLLSLIKQVSSKSDDKLNEPSEEGEVEEVGQYGTGFITTHAFGKRFEISGSLEIEPGIYIDLTEFEIDRVASKSSVLAGKLVDQQNAVFALIENSEFTNRLNDTTFTYFFDEDQERENAKDALGFYTSLYVPLVMALNGRIKSIMLENTINGTNKIFEKEAAYEKDKVQVNPIKIDGKDITDIFSLHDAETELIIILPLASRYQTRTWGEDVGKLFLYFPLIGTEAWGSNFIIHCGKFSPTEKRDGLHLKSGNSQTKEKEKSNRDIIDIASKMVFDFMKSNETLLANPINLAPIAFVTNSDHNLVNEYYEFLKLKWVEEFERIKLVEINPPPQTDDGEIAGPIESNLITPDEASFLADDFSRQPGYWDAIYKIVSKFWDKIPKSALSEQWTKIVLDWNDPNLDFVTIDAVCEFIKIEGDLTKFDHKTLLEFYSFLVKNGHAAVFETYAILPNIKNGFETKSKLRTADSIHPVFLKVADVVVSDVPKLFIQNSFILNQEYFDYSRKQLSKDWNARFSELIQTMNADHLLTDETRDALILLCSTFPSLDNRAVRGNIIDMIKKFYANDIADVQIPNIEDDFMEYAIPLKCLFSHFLYDIVKRSRLDLNWVENHLQLMHEALPLLSGKLFEDIKKSHPVFPDQNYVLKVQDSLLIQDDIPKGLKELYDEVFSRDVKKDLILEGFESYLPHEMTKTGATLAGEINTHLESVGSYHDVNAHPLKTIVSKILTLITGKDAELWSKLFITISERKEMIMMAKITKKEVKDSMFSILDLEDKKIKMLGDLARDEDMIRIIELGKESFALEQSTKADFDFKHSIGTHIERLLFDRIKNDMDKKAIEVITQSKQDGQDIVVQKNGESIYYIEVKSRWNSKSVVSMSRNQMNRSVEHPDVYTLCCVDMVNYHPDEGNRNYPEDITLILNRIKSVTDIGTQIAPLIDNAIVSEKDEDAVKLIGEYRATIPQKIIGRGLDFLPFIDFLYNKLVELLAIEK